VSRPTRGEICVDLSAEHEALADMIDGLASSDWRRATPSPEWSIAEQISHLAFFDHRAALALTDPDAFVADRARLIEAAPRDLSVELGRLVSADELLGEWVTNRDRLLRAARDVDESVRVPWYGPSMAVSSFLTARLMETWAHGCDVADALERPIVPSARLRHVAHIGVSARPYSLMVNGREADTRPVHVELTAPDGDLWAWGEPDAEGGAVSGSALDFCLVVTQRRHLADTSLNIRGDAALTWMDIAQAFAGPAGPGRPPLDR